MARRPDREKLAKALYDLHPYTQRYSPTPMGVQELPARPYTWTWDEISQFRRYSLLRDAGLLLMNVELWDE